MALKRGIAPSDCPCFDYRRYTLVRLCMPATSRANLVRRTTRHWDTRLIAPSGRAEPQATHLAAR
jgi:hypothetical protein